ncbi:MAG: thiopurine S-methyltransferase [Nitrosomonas sp.]|nr:MAG: thiopurine S-methyltransferase [Nitrosomonas sp.]
MKKAYWLDRWERQDIGFHQAEANTHLCAYWQRLCLTPGDTVLVPLCGKSNDMLWLAQQGYPVLGIEVSPLAAQAFFAENGLVPQCKRQRRFLRLESGDVRILCGDFFDLQMDDVVNVRAVYDRAALIALPPDTRKRYACHLEHILPPDISMLLITLEYPDGEIEGPPFPVAEEEVDMLYTEYAQIELLHRQDVLEQNPKFKARGLRQLREAVFRLKAHR